MLPTNEDLLEGQIRTKEFIILDLTRIVNTRDEEIVVLKNSIRNQQGDNLCWIKDIEAAKILPAIEFFESCKRYHAQVVQEVGEFKNGKTIAQLEAENLELKEIIKSLRHK